MILAKCCHDMDILRWLVGKKCEDVYKRQRERGMKPIKKIFAIIAAAFLAMSFTACGEGGSASSCLLYTSTRR